MSYNYFTLMRLDAELPSEVTSVSSLTNDFRHIQNYMDMISPLTLLASLQS